MDLSLIPVDSKAPFLQKYSLSPEGWYQVETNLTLDQLKRQGYDRIIEENGRLFLYFDLVTKIQNGTVRIGPDEQKGSIRKFPFRTIEIDGVPSGINIQTLIQKIPDVLFVESVRSYNFQNGRLMVQVQLRDLTVSDFDRLIIEKLGIGVINRDNREWAYKLGRPLDEIDLKFVENVSQDEIFRIRLSKEIMAKMMVDEVELADYLGKLGYQILTLARNPPNFQPDFSGIFWYVRDTKFLIKDLIGYIQEIKGLVQPTEKQIRRWSITFDSARISGLHFERYLLNLGVGTVDRSWNSLTVESLVSPYLLFLQVMIPSTRMILDEFEINDSEGRRFIYPISNQRVEDLCQNKNVLAELFDSSLIADRSFADRQVLPMFPCRIVNQSELKQFQPPRNPWEMEEKRELKTNQEYLEIKVSGLAPAGFFIPNIPIGQSFSNWIIRNQNNFFDPFKPIYLPEPERHRISDEVYQRIRVRSGVEECRQLLESEQKKFLVQWLSEDRVTPLAVRALIRVLIKYGIGALVSSGLTVGILGAEALSGPITQATLNSFHSAGGGKNIARSIERLKEYLTKKGSPRILTTNIHLRNKDLTYEQALRLKEKFTQLTLLDLMSRTRYPEIIPVDPQELDWWYPIFFQINGYGKFPYYQPGSNVPANQIPTRFLRIYFDPLVLYDYRISTERIAQFFEDYSDHKIFLRCLPSPTFVGAVDVYPIREKIDCRVHGDIRFTEDENEECFLRMTILVKLNEMQISGVEGIKNIYPQSLPTLSVVYKETLQPVPLEQKVGSVWRVELDQTKIVISGIDQAKVAQVFELAEIKVIQNNEENRTMIVQMPPGTGNTKPSRYVSDLIDSKQPQYKALTQASDYIYLEAEGQNLVELLSDPEVDDRCTISNDPYEINEVLGVEATRNFLLREIIKMINNPGSEMYTDPRHIRIPIDFMTNQGSLYPVSFAGLSRQPVGPLTLATMRDAMKSFDLGSAFGRREETKNLSARIYVASRMEMGTGQPGLTSEEDSQIEKLAQEIAKLSSAPAEEKKIAPLTEEKKVLPEITLVSRRNLRTQRNRPVLPTEPVAPVQIQPVAPIQIQPVAPVQLVQLPPPQPQGQPVFRRRRAV